MNDGMTQAKNYKIKSHNKAGLFDRRAFQLSIISKSNILLQNLPIHLHLDAVRH